MPENNPAQRAQELLNTLTLEEKLYQISGQMIFDVADDYEQKRNHKQGNFRNPGHFMHFDRPEPATPAEVTARILSRSVDTVEPPFGATLYQAIPKGDKMGEIVEKAVECGVTRIVPVLTERCVSRPDPKAMEGKRARWQKIAESAAKQSGRGVIPEIAPMCSFAQAVEELGHADLPLFCYEGEGTRPLAQVLREQTPVGKDVRFFIGSEGGFSQSEAEAATAAGLCPIGLGKRILRTETAAAFVLACLVYEAELG